MAQSACFGGFVEYIKKLVIAGDMINPYDIRVVEVALYFKLLNKFSKLWLGNQAFLNYFKCINGFVSHVSRLKEYYCAR